MDRKTSFIIYPADFLAAVHNFKKSQVYELIIALCQFNLYGKLDKKLSDVVQEKFDTLQKIIDTNNAKYAEICEKRKAIGSKGGSKPKANVKQKSTAKQTSPRTEDEEDKEQDNDSVFIKNNKNKGAENVDNSGFVGAPSVEDVADYAQSSGYTIDPIAFVNWHAERGWRHGKKYMAVDWQKAVRKWYCKENGLSMDEMESMSDICSGILSKIKGTSHDNN